MGSNRLIALALALAAGAAPAQETSTAGETAPPADQQPAAEAPPAPAPATPIPVPQPAPAAEADHGPAQLDNVVVTAERKVESLQQTPVSIEAFNADKLQLRSIDGLAGLAVNVPNMSIEPFPTHNGTLRMFIRGVGTADAQVTQDPAVGVYVDGVYIARSVGLAVDLADLERIEVLRGPQGTLYGRNTTGGAVNLITKRPDPGAFSMAHELTVGTQNQVMAKSSFNLPVTDSLAFKLAVIGQERNGFVDNTGPGGDFSDKREGAARLDARWRGDWLTADYSYDQTDMKYYNGMFQAVNLPRTSHGLGDYFKNYAATQTVYSTQRIDALATTMPMDPSGSKIHGHSLTLAVPLSLVEVKYTAALRYLTDDEYIDFGGGKGSTGYRLDTEYYDGPSTTLANGGPTPAVVPQVFQRQWSHEIQLSGAMFETLEFVAGAFAFGESGGENGHPIHHILNAYLDPSQIPSNPVLSAAVVGLSSPRLVAYWDYDYAIHNTAKAVYSQLTWSPDFLDRRFHATLGGRKSWDHRHALKNFAQTIYAEGNTAGGGEGASPVPSAFTPGSDVFTNVSADRGYTDFSPSANLRYDVLKDATVYVSSARSYKSGGFNVRDPQISKASGAASDGTNYGFGFIDGFRPEYVQSYELGLKSEWFGHRLRFNADVFDSRFTDMQTNFLIAGSISDTKALNVGKARMRGVETETTFVAWPGLVLAFDYAYLSARVLEVRDINGNNVANLYPFVSAPPQSYVGSIDWTFLEAAWGTLRAYAAYNYIGRRDGLIITPPRDGMTRLDQYGLFNARVTANGIRLGSRGTVEVGLWGHNLADKQYNIFAIDNLPQADRAVLWGDPRSFGTDLVYRFF